MVYLAIHRPTQRPCFATKGFFIPSHDYTVFIKQATGGGGEPSHRGNRWPGILPGPLAND